MRIFARDVAGLVLVGGLAACGGRATDATECPPSAVAPPPSSGGSSGATSSGGSSSSSSGGVTTPPSPPAPAPVMRPVVGCRGVRGVALVGSPHWYGRVVDPKTGAMGEPQLLVNTIHTDPRPSFTFLRDGQMYSLWYSGELRDGGVTWADGNPFASTSGGGGLMLPGGTNYRPYRGLVPLTVEGARALVTVHAGSPVDAASAGYFEHDIFALPIPLVSTATPTPRRTVRTSTALDTVGTVRGADGVERLAFVLASKEVVEVDPTGDAPPRTLRPAAPNDDVVALPVQDVLWKLAPATSPNTLRTAFAPLGDGSVTAGPTLAVDLNAVTHYDLVATECANDP